MVCTWLIDSDQFESAKVKAGGYFMILILFLLNRRRTYLIGEMH